MPARKYAGHGFLGSCPLVSSPSSLTIWNGAEMFKPFGNYSMAAIITAEKEGIA